MLLCVFCQSSRIFKVSKKEARQFLDPPLENLAAIEAAKWLMNNYFSAVFSSFLYVVPNPLKLGLQFFSWITFILFRRSWFCFHVLLSSTWLTSIFKTFLLLLGQILLVIAQYWKWFLKRNKTFYKNFIYSSLFYFIIYLIA